MKFHINAVYFGHIATIMKCTYYTARLKICILEVSELRRYMVELVTMLLEIHCTCAKEKQLQITNYVLSHSQTETVLLLDNLGHAKHGCRKLSRKMRLKCQQNWFKFEFYHLAHLRVKWFKLIARWALDLKISQLTKQTGCFTPSRFLCLFVSRVGMTFA